MVKITNTLTGRTDPIERQYVKEIKIYVCGITPYDYAHVGHGRVYVVFDVLFRLLKFLGYHPQYCRNYTDIDDKILNKAEQELGDRNLYKAVAETFITAFDHDMAMLNCLRPQDEPRVTEHIPDIIRFISRLIELNKAYVVDGDVYFSLKSFPHYGKLSKHRLEDLRSGERIEVNEKKRDPLDFALWKAETTGTFWSAPWGYGRPGWHVECATLIWEHLESCLDIHGGGLDLIFPHHENEIALAESFCPRPLSRFWMHIGYVRVNKEKMSKSRGNFFTLRDLFKQFDPMVIRYYYFTQQYRTPLDFSLESLESAKTTYERLRKLFTLSPCDSSLSKQELMKSPIVTRMIHFLKDNLNIPRALALIFENYDALKNDEAERCSVKVFLKEVLGLVFEAQQKPETIITEEIKELIEEREYARKVKDWKRADELRAQLILLGYEVHDKKIDS